MDGEPGCPASGSGPGGADTAVAGRSGPQPPPAASGPSALRWQDLADAVWLMAHSPRTGAPIRTGGDSPETEPAGVPELPPHVSRQEPPDPPKDDTATSAAPSFTPDPDGSDRVRLGVPALAPTRSTAPADNGPAAELARVLHHLSRQVPSHDAVQLDEETTAERGIFDELWLPSFRPADVTAFELVILMDETATMAVWRAETAALAAAAEHSGAFRAVRAVDVVVPRNGEPRLRWSAAGTTADPGEVLNGRKDRIFLVVTDGLRHGWAAPAADRLLGRLGRAGPTALVHLLPPHMRHRSSLYPYPAELEAGGFGAANHRLGLRPSAGGLDPMRPLPQLVDGALPVPVLSLKAGSFSAWADLVLGERGVRRTLPAVVAGTLYQGAPAPGLRAPRRSGAGDAVGRFFTLATPAARRLATHVAAIPFDFDLIDQLRKRTMPTAGPEHLAEILMGGLIDWGGRDMERPDFADGIREALLATTTRAQLARIIGVLGELPAAGEQAVALRAALRDPYGTALPDPDAGAWRASELAVMRALAGPYAERARRIEVERDVPGVVNNRPARRRARPAGRRAVEQPAAQPVTASQEPDQYPTKTGQGMNRTSTEPPALLVNVPLRNTTFVGRQALLRTVEEQLAAQDTAAVLPHALHGLGGVGKSQLVLEYIYTHQHDYRVICWIPAERESLVLAALATLAAQLGVAPAEQDTVGVPAAGTAVPAALEALRAGVPYDNWLLVFDNAEDVEMVRGYFPANAPGKIIVTSRNRGWERVATSLLVNVFEREESIELLQKRAADLPREDADRLAEALGDLPLAVEQAGAWLGVTGMEVDEYLELLARRSPEILEIEQSPDYPVSVAAAWDISLERIRENNPGARQLLDICASMAPEPIPRSILRSSRGVNITPQIDPMLREPIKLNRAIRDLSQFSLIKVDPRAGTLQMHRLLQTVLLAKLSEEERERMRDAAHQLLSAANRGPYGSSLEWRAYQALLPHVLASQAVTSTDPYVRDLVYDTMWFLYYWGDHEGAAAFGRQAWSAWLAASGEEDIYVIRMIKGFAFLLRRTGQIAESIPLTEKALEVSRRVQVEPEELIDSLCDMSDARRYQGRFQEARDLGREATELARSLFGPDDQATLRGAHSLGVDLRLCGQFKEALTLDQETARQRDALLGDASFFTLNTLHCVGIDTREAGRYPEAREFQEDVYRRALTALGDKNPLTLRIARDLGVCRRRDGNLAEGAKLAEDTLRNFATRYGDEHLDTLTTAANVSVDRRLAGDLEGSHRLAGTTADRLERRLGANHAHTLLTRANLAATERALGALDAAQELEDDVVRRLSDTVGPHHIITLTVGIGQANTFYGRLDFERAHAIDSVNLPLLTEVAGEGHPLTLSCISNLSLDLRGLGRADEADALQRKAVEGFAAVLRNSHPWLQAARQRRRIECDIAPMPM
ncbi:FxSxx-COOH system tetratricopeptide repeat protein [Streptomyces sp. DH10]|uniref:FxSxx-COOH system tetratricopeptide repeat protein n=1 Tax=Streptomyces sp. DH10 TaxID=3040121 RepID=UPI0024434C6F|nr:FxSxx-COOH system tetratricopeptide repeat protein [Streptomyces sp. DH10]MDG9709032.1 FxSxx-COOH system tetratricopeptide repeat protein [Streptomyces sp. DH10]